MSGATSGLEFDLSTAPQISPRGAAIGRVIALGCAVSLGVLVTSIAAYNQITGVVRGLPSPIGLFLIGSSAIFVGAAATIYFGLGPGASQCVWEADGFTLRYRSGRVRSFRWNDPQLRFEVSEITYEGEVEYDLSTRMPWHNDLTMELYQAIIAEAHQRGLDVRTRVSGIPAQRIVTNRIQSKARTRP
jgi:hypothetical protein